ncbi:MAG: hypothetical protein WCK48_01900 [bacterium]
MGKRGPKPKEIVKIKWSPDFAYAMGLLATDGCLSKDGRHIDLTSKDFEQVKNFLRCLKLGLKIGKKTNGTNSIFFRVQIGDVLFYEFLKSIGFSQAKSLILGEIKIPKVYFFDFLRGCFDGDGSSYSYWDPRWKSSFMFYVCFTSASPVFIQWIRTEIKKRTKIEGFITQSKSKNPCYSLRYAKNDGLEIIKEMYYNADVVCLSRKRKKIGKMLEINNKQQDLYI